MNQVILIYLVIINIAGFFFMWLDKRNAKRKRRRIPERVLFAAAVFGGSLGSILGMQMFHHKTKHNSFVFGMPAILAVQVVLIVCLKNVIGAV